MSSIAYQEPNEWRGSPTHWLSEHVKCDACNCYTPATAQLCSIPDCGAKLPKTFKCDVCDAVPVDRVQAVRRKQLQCPCQANAENPKRYPGISLRRPYGMKLAGPDGRGVQLFSYLVPDKSFPSRPHLLHFVSHRETVRLFRLETGYYRERDGKLKIANHYGQFPHLDEAECIKWAASFPPNVQQCFQETVIGPQRIWFDIDWKRGENGVNFSDEEWRVILNHIIDAAVAIIVKLCDAEEALVRKRFAVYESHGQRKRSNHLVFLYWVENSASVRVIQGMVQDRLPATENAPRVDVCANDNRNFRIPGSWKFCCCPADEKRILRLTSESPVQKDLLVGLPTGGPPHLKVGNVSHAGSTLRTQRAVSSGEDDVGRTTASTGISALAPQEVQDAFSLAKLFIDPFGQRHLELMGESRHGCFPVKVSGPNPVGFPCVHCGVAEEHPPHGNPDLFLSYNKEWNWWSLRSYRAAAAPTPTIPSKKKVEGGKRFSPPIQLGPVRALTNKVPDNVQQIILERHEKLFACWSGKLPVAPRPTWLDSDLVLQEDWHEDVCQQDTNDWKDWELDKIGAFFADHELGAFNEILAAEDDLSAFISGFSFDDAMALELPAVDPAHLFAAVCILRGGCAVDWMNYANVVIQSMCNTGKTTQLKLILEAFITQFLCEHGRFPRILFGTVRIAQARNFTEELNVWYEEFTRRLGMPHVNGVTCYKELSGQPQRYRSTQFLVLQMESAHHLVEALNDISRWRDQPFDVVVLDEITSILKQLSSPTMARLNHALFLLEQPTTLRVLLDNDIDQRCWDFLTGIKAGSTVLYKNTFRVCDAAVARRAFRVSDRSTLHAMIMADLEKGECVAFHEASRKKLIAFASSAQAHADQLHYSMLVYHSDKTYVIVPPEYQDQLTEKERGMLRVFSRDQISSRTSSVYGWRYADTVQALDADLTLKDINRWWNYDWVRFIGYTSTITVGLDFNRRRIPAFYAIFGAEGPIVRDAFQAHFRCRQVRDLYYVIDCRRSFNADYSELSEKHLELAQLSAPEAVCGTRSRFLWSEDDAWATASTERDEDGSRKAVRWHTSQRAAETPFEPLPKWFQSIQTANKVEEQRSKLLTEVETLRFLSHAGYIFVPCPKAKVPSILDQPSASTPTAMLYDEVELLSDERRSELLYLRERHVKLMREDQFALTRYYFDTVWLRNQPKGDCVDIWNGYLAADGDKSRADLTNYSAASAARQKPPSAAIFYQVLEEMRFRLGDDGQPAVTVEEGDETAGLPAVGVRLNPLHLSLMSKRRDAMIEICSALGLDHSQDSTKEFFLRDFESFQGNLLQLNVEKLWARRKRTLHTPVSAFVLLNHVFSRWSGMTFVQTVHRRNVTNSKRADFAPTYRLNSSMPSEVPLLAPLLIQSMSMADNAKPLFDDDDEHAEMMD